MSQDKAPVPDAKEGAPSRKLGRIFVILFVVALLAVSAISLTTNLKRLWSTPSGAAQQGRITTVPEGRERLEIASGTMRHAFNVEVMRNAERRAKGLMFRQSMPADEGMLFDFERDQMVMMWMKNTYLTLDMVFILADGRIHRIEANTEPMSERTISSGQPVRAVLELNAGTSAKLGLKPGDRVLHPMFGKN
jgi:uncharacterized protein